MAEACRLEASLKVVQPALVPKPRCWRKRRRRRRQGITEMLKRAADLGAPRPSACNAVAELPVNPPGSLPLMMGTLGLFPQPVLAACPGGGRSSLSR